MKKIVSSFLVLVITLAALAAFMVSANASGYYIHDPMENPKAAADIIVDPNAVYGYAPNPASTRLGSFADYDWSDATFVAQMRQEREEYHASLQELYQLKADMEAQGKSAEEIARAVSTRRNEMRMEAYKDDPVGLAKLKESNLATFGNENGGTPEYFYNEYGSWEMVIEKAFSTNAGADAILGLYDKYYDTYYFDNKERPTEPQESTEPAIKVTEPTATVAETITENATADEAQRPATPDGNLSKTSPKTGDPVILLLILMLTATGVIVWCVVKLTRHN